MEREPLLYLLPNALLPWRAQADVRDLLKWFFQTKDHILRPRDQGRKAIKDIEEHLISAPKLKKVVNKNKNSNKQRQTNTPAVVTK